MSDESALTLPMPCNSIRNGKYVMLKKNYPCKVVSFSVSKTGKHGHAKMAVVGIDIFSGKKHEDIFPTSHSVTVPRVTRDEYQLLDVDEDGYLTLMSAEGETKEDLNLPDNEDGEKIREQFEDGKELIICVIGAMDKEAILSFREGSIN